MDDRGCGESETGVATLTSLGAFEGSRREILGEYVFRRRLRCDAGMRVRTTVRSVSGIIDSCKHHFTAWRLVC
jgi:hypothetical protein